MALVEKRVCDVFGTTKDVQSYRVHVEENVGKPDEDAVTLIDERVDCSPAGAARMLRWIRRSMLPPPKKKA